MNTYPAIYKCVDGLKYLYLDKQNYYSFERKIWDKSRAYANHFNDGNITHEYLTNTYGKVESKEHAEFIVKLAEGAGFAIDMNYLEGHKFFCFCKEILLFSNRFTNEKLITIPLPPKDSEAKSWPQVGDEVLTASGAIAIVLAIKSKYAWIKYLLQNPESNKLDYYSTVETATLKKPLTPEEDLTNKLIEITDEYRNSDLSIQEVIAKAIINGEIEV